jgi:hypothetical protein
VTARRSPRRSAKAPPPSPYPEVGLAELGLAPGDTVRFRRRGSERWKQGVVSRREKDGSIGLHDSRGSARSIEIDLLEVRSRGPRGGVVWESLAERAARTEQMPLVRPAPVEARRRIAPLRADDTEAPAGGEHDGAADDAPAAVGDVDDTVGTEQLRLL